MISNQRCIPPNEDSVPSYQIQIAQVEKQKHKGKQKEHNNHIENVSNMQQDFKDGKIKEQLLEISEYLHDPSSFGPWIPQEGSYNELIEKNSFQPRGSSRRIYSSKISQKRIQSNRNHQGKLDQTAQSLNKTNKTTIKDDQTKLNSTYEEECKIPNNFSQQESFLDAQYAQSAQLSNRQSIFLEQTLEEEQNGSAYECQPQNSNLKSLLKPNPRRVSSTPQQIMQSHEGDKNCCYNMPLRCTLPRFLKGKGQKIKSEYNQYIKINQGVQPIPSSEEERLRHVKEFKNIAKRKPRLSLINQVIDSILLDAADSNQNTKQENMSSEGLGVHNSQTNNPSGQSSSFEFKYKPPHSATLALSKNIQSIKAFISSKTMNGNSYVSSVVKPNENAQSYKNNHLNEEKQHQSNGFKSACVMVLNPLAIPIPQEDYFLLSKEALESSQEKRAGSSFAGSRSKSLVDTFPQNFSLERISQKNINEKEGQTPQWGYQDFNFVAAQKDGQVGLQKQNSVDYSFSRAESAGGRITLQDKQFVQRLDENLGGPLKSRLVTPNITNLHSQTSSQLQQPNQNHHLQSKGYDNQYTRQGIQEYNIQWNKKSVSKYQSQITNFMSNLDAQLSTKENRSKSPVLSKEYSKKKPQYLRQSIQLQSQQDKSKPQVQGSFAKMAGIQRINEQNNNQLISVNCRRIL